MLRKATAAAFAAATIAIGLAGCSSASAGSAAQQSSPKPPASQPPEAGCERTTSTVHLVPTDTTTSFSVAGWLCGPRDSQQDTVQLLVHGFSYNHLYWMGLGDQQLSYIQTATQQHHTTFVIDQIGAGASDHPDPSLPTIPNLAYVLHQLVGQLRDGSIGSGHIKFRRVVGVGHSLGAATVIVEAGMYHDMDAVVLADFLHATDPGFVNTLRAHYVTANTMSQFAKLPAGYLTVEPRNLFYNTALADPKVLALDEQIGVDTGASGQAASLAVGRDPQYSKAIAVPVLVVTGRQDALGCNDKTAGLSCATVTDVLTRERPFYTSTKCLGVYVLDGGHDTNLHPDAPKMFAYANTWIDGALRGSSQQPSSAASNDSTCL